MKAFLLSLARNRGVQKALLALVAALAAAAGLSQAGCGIPVAEVPAYDLCLDRAEFAAQARFDAECPDGKAACPALDSILEQLQRDQEACS